MKILTCDFCGAKFPDYMRYSEFSEHGEGWHIHKIACVSCTEGIIWFFDEYRKETLKALKKVPPEDSTKGKQSVLPLE
ncbi:MAG: hypothetical protein QXV17_07820 [Candidatus Micrarchaeaceae archaeon]